MEMSSRKIETSEPQKPELPKTPSTLQQPQNLRVTRRVGADSLLLAWSPPDDDNVTGYAVSLTSI